MSENITLKNSNGTVKTLLEVAPPSKLKRKSKKKIKRVYVTSPQKEKNPNNKTTQIIETIHVYRESNKNQRIENLKLSKTVYSKKPETENVKPILILPDEKTIESIVLPDSLKPNEHYENYLTATEIESKKIFDLKMSPPEIISYDVQEKKELDEKTKILKESLIFVESQFPQNHMNEKIAYSTNQKRDSIKTINEEKNDFLTFKSSNHTKTDHIVTIVEKHEPINEEYEYVLHAYRHRSFFPWLIFLPLAFIFFNFLIQFLFFLSISEHFFMFYELIYN
jgi:hypothetical protein